MADNNTPQEQDRDDGLLFFHTHSIWEAMHKLEQFYECKIYGVLEVQEVVDNLSYDGEYSNVSKQLWLDAIDYAYDKVDDSADYQIYLDRVAEFIDYINKQTANKQGGHHANKI